jgi:nucleoside-diphosphate-sugar epimerase
MGKRYVVTGGGGFVGKAISCALTRRGDSVLSLARGEYPELKELGIESARVDISSDYRDWVELLKGASGVFHTAAKVEMWGRYRDFFKVNVEGTRSIIRACNEAGVRHLVFTSSPSVIHSGEDLRGIDESVPYPKAFHAHYPETKAKAEREVLAADSGSAGVGLRTVALRPHLIWGPGDSNLVPTILERARAGKLTRIGKGSNIIDLTYIDDCVAAHLLAMARLEERGDVGGRVYFISQGEPVNMWAWIDRVLSMNGLPAVKRSIPRGVANLLACCMQGVARGCEVLRLDKVGISYTPLLTQFLVSEMAGDHYFSIEAARRDLGYAPSCSIEQALERTFGSGI